MAISEKPVQAAQATGVATDAPPPGWEQWTSDARFFGHPRGLATLFFTEMWERFSYYGIRPLLVLYMSLALAGGGFGFERTQASAIVGIYAASVYLASLPGGWVADRWLGLRRSILVGAVLISLGHISIGLSSFLGSKVPFFVGLILIVCGTGMLKPNISAIVGDLYPEGGARRDAGFSIYYMGINTGAFIGQLVTGFLGEKIGWGYGFGAAGVGMILGLITFAVTAPRTLGEIGTSPTRHPDPMKQARRVRTVKLTLAIAAAVIVLVIALAATGAITINPQAVGTRMTYVLVGTGAVYFLYIFVAGGLTGNEKRRVAVIAVLFVAAAIFWSAFEQAPTSLNLFARDFTDRTIGSFEIPATWFQSVNAMFVILLAPVAAAVWLALGRRQSGDLSSPSKFALGLAFAAAGFALMIVAANHVVASNGAVKVSPWWLVFSYLFQTMGEVSLSPVGLSSMTKLSPRRYVGQMMGIWFLASALGNLIAGLLGGHVDPSKLEQTPRVFTVTTISLLISAGVLALLVIPIRRMMGESKT